MHARVVGLLAASDESPASGIASPLPWRGLGNYTHTHIYIYIYVYTHSM